jgi:hypothetical protein
MYKLFTSEFHEPYFLVTWETENGWEMLGDANLYANIPGEPTPDQKKVTDGQGREWDVVIPSGFKFHYTKKEGAPGGIAISRTEITSDALPPIQIAVARGVIKF